MKHPPAEWGSTVFGGVSDLESRYRSACRAADRCARLKAMAAEVEREAEALLKLGVGYGSRIDALNHRRNKLRQLLPEASQAAMVELRALHARLFGGWRWLRERARKVGIPLDESGDYWKRPYADFIAALRIVEKAESRTTSPKP